MSNLGKFAILLAIVVIVSAVTCWSTSCVMMCQRPPSSDFHHWLHTRLGITAEQDKALEQEEARFAAQRKELVLEIQNDNVELAAVMSQDREYSPRVQDAVDKIRRAQSALEKATLEHIFAMKPILTPAQFDQLLTLTREALNGPSDL